MTSHEPKVRKKRKRRRLKPSTATNIIHSPIDSPPPKAKPPRTAPKPPTLRFRPLQTKAHSAPATTPSTQSIRAMFQPPVAAAPPVTPIGRKPLKAKSSVVLAYETPVDMYSKTSSRVTPISQSDESEQQVLLATPAGEIDMRELLARADFFQLDIEQEVQRYAQDGELRALEPATPSAVDDETSMTAQRRRFRQPRTPSPPLSLDSSIESIESVRPQPQRAESDVQARLVEQIDDCDAQIFKLPFSPSADRSGRSGALRHSALATPGPTPFAINNAIVAHLRRKLKQVQSGDVKRAHALMRAVDSVKKADKIVTSLAMAKRELGIDAIVMRDVGEALVVDEIESQSIANSQSAGFYGEVESLSVVSFSQ